MAEDYYNVLGIERGASQEDIKQAYRRLAHKHHPDKDGGNEDEFKRVNAAYQVLGDDEKRAQYDQFGATAEDVGGGAPPGWGGFNINVEDLGGVGDIFEQFFGGRGKASRGVRRGNDVPIDMTISFIESAQGVKREIKTRLYQACSHCKANGAEPGTPISKCKTCNGAGVIKQSRQTIMGVFTQESVCNACHGSGSLPDKPCGVCRGEGREIRDLNLEVEIPAGIANGQAIRLSGKGEMPAHGGVPGDMYVTVHVKDHPTMKRDGDDIRSSLNMSFVDLVLGSKVEVDTLKGKQLLDIPAGTQPGDDFALNAVGFPRLGGSGVGNHIVSIDVEIPKRLSRKQKKLLEEYRAGDKRKHGLFS